jgi:hypothetical protein
VIPELRLCEGGTVVKVLVLVSMDWLHIETYVLKQFLLQSISVSFLFTLSILQSPATKKTRVNRSQAGCLNA